MNHFALQFLPGQEKENDLDAEVKMTLNSVILFHETLSLRRVPLPLVRYSRKRLSMNEFVPPYFHWRGKEKKAAPGKKV